MEFLHFSALLAETWRARALRRRGPLPRASTVPRRTTHGGLTGARFGQGKLKNAYHNFDNEAQNDAEMSFFRQQLYGYTLPLEAYANGQNHAKLKFCGNASDRYPAVRGSRRGKARCRRDRSRYRVRPSVHSDAQIVIYGTAILKTKVPFKLRRWRDGWMGREGKAEGRSTRSLSNFPIFSDRCPHHANLQLL